MSEKSFIYCDYIIQNYNIIYNNNCTGYGVASLVHKRLAINNMLLHPNGRLILFDLDRVTHINLYLPAGQEAEARKSREDMISKDLPDYLLLAQADGVLGGDFNCVSNPQDLTHLVDHKISTNLQKLIRIKKMTDTFRHLQPKVKTFSHFYTWKCGDGSMKQGGLRLDRSYSLGLDINQKIHICGNQFQRPSPPPAPN